MDLEQSASIEKSLTIKQLCKAEQFSPAHYYNLRARGLGPRETRFGNSVRITPENRREWHRRLQEDREREAAEAESQPA